jgi:hypothetical protein
MTIRLSTGLALAMTGSYGLQAMMNYGYVDVYSGVQPISPDLPPAETDVRLGRITTDGLAHVVGSAADGALKVDQTETGLLTKSGSWILTGVDAGIATWWRWHWNSFDDNTQTFFYPRMDGDVGESLVLAETDITILTSVEISSFNVQFRG